MLVAATIVEQVFTITGSQTMPNNQLETTVIHNINVKNSFIRRIEAENRERAHGSNNSNTASDTSGSRSSRSSSSISPPQRLLRNKENLREYTTVLLERGQQLQLLFDTEDDKSIYTTRGVNGIGKKNSKQSRLPIRLFPQRTLRTPKRVHCCRLLHKSRPLRRSYPRLFLGWGA